jgi:palmitoyl transferase
MDKLARRQAMARWILVASCAWVAHASAQPVNATPAPSQAAEPAPMPTAPLRGNPFVSDETLAKEPAQRTWLTCTGMWSWFASQCEGMRDSWYEGRPTVYFSGYTWHDPHTYTQEKLESFNAHAWGGGYGWTKTVGNGDSFGWYALAFRDSHYSYTKAVGWSWVTYWPQRSDFAVGLGYTAFIASRPDIANNWPFPAALPLASVKLRKLEVMGTFIPKLNAGINHGDVAWFFGRYTF